MRFGKADIQLQVHALFSYLLAELQIESAHRVSFLRCHSFALGGRVCCFHARAATSRHAPELELALTTRFKVLAVKAASLCAGHGYFGENISDLESRNREV